MEKEKKKKKLPRGRGGLICFLLAVSWGISHFMNQSDALMAGNSVLVSVILLLCIRLVLKTFGMQGGRFPDRPVLYLLPALPVVNLIVNVLSVVSDKLGALFSTPPAEIVLTLIGLPVFFCAYFRVLGRICGRTPVVKGLLAALMTMTGFYLSARLVNKIVLPLLTKGGVTAPAWLWSVSGAYTYITLLIYLFCAVCFLLPQAFPAEVPLIRKEENKE